MPTFDSNGIAIHYVDEGSGPTIVLVHGFAAGPADETAGHGTH